MSKSSRLVAYVVLMVMGSVLVFMDQPEQAMETSTRRSALGCAKPAKPNATVGWVRPPVVFGHVHIAQTGGTNLNGYLAAYYERVCGSKGYSYDSYKYNLRAKESRDQGDLISKIYPGYNRGNVPLEVIEEIGYEDCDYISMEIGWDYWAKQFQDWPMELHMPCRDPIDHLMSQCNAKKIEFSCTNQDVEAEIEQCMMATDRFQNNEPTNLWCFDYARFDDYLEQMGTILQGRQTEADYIQRPTNQDRKKDEECIWQKPDLINKVRDILVQKYDYYSYCDKCLGSSNDLLHSL